jgi:hypothetical protein
MIFAAGMLCGCVWKTFFSDHDPDSIVFSFLFKHEIGNILHSMVFFGINYDLTKSVDPVITLSFKS